MSDRTQTLSVELERGHVEKLARNEASGTLMHDLCQAARAVLSQPEHQGDGIDGVDEMGLPRRERLEQIAASIDDLTGVPPWPDDADFLRSLASREHRGEEGEIAREKAAELKGDGDGDRG